MSTTTPSADMRSARPETRCPGSDAFRSRRRRSTSRDRALHRCAETELGRLPVLLRWPPFMNRSLDRTWRTPVASFRQCAPRCFLWSRRTAPPSNPILTIQRLYSCKGSRFLGSNCRARTTASEEPVPATEEASTTRIVASTILARRSAKSFGLTMGGNCTIRLPSL